MDKRICIGIPFSYQENWIAGTYYVTNLIHALNTLPEDQKPFIEAICDKPEIFEWIKSQTSYPYISYTNAIPHLSFIDRIVNKLSRLFLNRNLIQKFYTGDSLDILFPAVSNDGLFSSIPNYKKLYWIPDFQEHYYPNFFSEKELNARIGHQLALAEAEVNIVFSSDDARNDMLKFYPNARSILHTLRFAVTHPAYRHLDIKALKEKYVINGRYFFSPNQFWQHKDQFTILKAVALLKQQGLEIIVAFSGKANDYRNPDYYPSLMEYVKANGLEQNCLFLGFIDRSEQLQLMNHAIAIIQPSLFEGWSTVIEDAKAMNQLVIASNLPVNIEQLPNGAEFFPQRNFEALSKLLLNYIIHIPERPSIDYEKSVKFFAHSFISIIQRILSSRR